MPNKELGIADPIYDALRIHSGQSIAPDLGGGSFGAGALENKIYVWHTDGSTLDLFDPDAAGLDLALAAAASGDAVFVPACTITGDHTIPANVGVVAIQRRAAILTGEITLSASSSLQGLTIARTANSGSDLIAVLGPASGAAYLYDCDVSALQAGAGNGYAISAQAGDVYHRFCVFIATSNNIDSNPFLGQIVTTYSAGAEISTGAIPVTNSAGTTITGLSIGNWYAVEAFNGPWLRRAGWDSWDYRVSNDGGTTWLPSYPGYLGRTNDGIMHLDIPAWGAASEIVATDYARLYWQATTTSIKIRVGEDLQWADNTGTLSWRLRSATRDVTTTGGIYAYASETENDAGARASFPRRGDRAAYNTDDSTHAVRHASDISDETYTYHNDPDNPFQLTQLEDGHIWIGDADDSAQPQAVSGDATLDDTGALTLATVNSDVGSFTNANITVNAKGLITTAANGTTGATIVHDDLSASCNSSDVQFSTSATFVSGSTEVTLNGLLLRPGVGNSYVEDVGLASITLAVAPLTGDELLIAYVLSGTGAATLTISNVYIATTGSDVTGDGSSGTPYATLAKALSVLPDRLNSNCTIHIADGTYAEAIDIERFTSRQDTMLTLLGNTTTPANVVFTGVVSTIGVLVRGAVRVTFSGIKINVTANVGFSIREGATAFANDLIVTGTLTYTGIEVLDRAYLGLTSNITVTGIAGNGFSVYRHSTVLYTGTGTITVTGNGTTTTGMWTGYNSQFVVDFGSGPNIVITECLNGIQVNLCSIWQYWDGSGSITIDNASTPANSKALYITDCSTWSTQRPITLDHFTYGFDVSSLSYGEASGSRTITNVGTTSNTYLGGVTYLP